MSGWKTQEFRVTILGCGSSGGVPRIGGDWGACDPSEPRNRRRRCSVLFERRRGAHATRILIDAGPDMRVQLLDAQVGHLDAVLFTHAHADHVHGIDDLRVVAFNRRKRLPALADARTRDALFTRFGYIFDPPEGSPYSAVLDFRLLRAGEPARIEGMAGTLEALPIEVIHGRERALGFRVEDVVYIPDISAMTAAVWDALKGAKCWIIDALRRTPHPTHAHLSRTLEWIGQSGVPRAVITNMHVDLDYRALVRETPDHVMPAHDGMQIVFPYGAGKGARK